MTIRTPPFANNAVAADGQSLSVGGGGGSTLSTAQQYSNLKLHDSSATYDTSNPSAGTLSLTSCTGPLKAGGNGGSYPLNSGGEEIIIDIANAMTQLAAYDRFSSWKCFVSSIGITGANLATIKKGGSGNSYLALTYEANAAQLLKTGTLGYTGIFLVHGESDDQLATYSADVNTGLVTPSQTDIPAITSQAGEVPWFITQQCSRPDSSGDPGKYPISPIQQVVMLGVTSVYGAATNYPYAFIDTVHLTSDGYRQMGDKCAQAGYIYWLNRLGILAALHPTWPTSLVIKPGAFVGTVSNTVWTATYNVPFGNLVFSTAFTNPHATGPLSTKWGAAKGFEFTDLPGTITNAVTSAGLIKITQTAHGYSTGDIVQIWGVGGTTEANVIATTPAWTITVVDANSYTLNGSTFTNNYTSGGTAARCCAISSVTLPGSGVVVVTLAATPGTGGALSYAYSIDSVSNGGFGCNRGGLLCDQDPYVGPCSGVALVNWAWMIHQTGLT